MGPDIVPQPAAARSIAVRPAARNDLTALASMRADGGPGLLSRLGPRAARALLAGFATDPASIVWLASDGGAALGYVLATSHSLAVQRQVALREPDMWVATAWLLVRHPRTLAGVARRLALLVRPTKASRVTEEATVRLLDIFVAPAARGRGVGRQLLEACLAWATAAGHPAIGLTVDATNGPALRLYQDGGFLELARLAHPDGHSSIAMERRLTGDPGGGAASGTT